MTQTGLLLIHGTLGSPAEYATLEILLREKCYSTRVVSLPGHGNRPRKALTDVTADEMLEHCLAEYLVLTESCERVVLVGHSLGAMCALLIASAQPRALKGVVSLASPFEHAHFVNYPQGFLNMPFPRLVSGLKYMPQGYTGLDQPLFMPWWFPKLTQEATLLFSRMQQDLHRIDVPVYLAHSPHDMIVPYAEMEKIARAIGKPHLVTQHTLRCCGHQVFPRRGEEAFVTKLILHFLKELEEAERYQRTLPA